MVREYSYNVGEEVNGLKILKQTVNKHKQKTYEVQSLKYPTAPTYIIAEYSLINGYGDSYSNGKRVFEGNSIYNVEHVKKYIVNIEESKTIHEGSTKTIELLCRECGFSKKSQARHVRDNGFNCLCKSNTSFPELFMLAYIEVKGLDFEYQSLLDNSLRRFDFYNRKHNVVIETHGEQHYNKNSTWYKGAKEQDVYKRKYCKENNIKLIELDCRESTFEFIEKSIKNSELENISLDEKERMVNIINGNKKIPVKDIIESYKNEMSVNDISIKYNIGEHIIYNVLRSNNVKYKQRGKKVKCIETGEVFKSVKEASIWAGLKSNSSKITESIKRYENRKYAGKHPITGEKLRWEWA